MNKYSDTEKRAELDYAANKELIRKLKRKPASDLDERVSAHHYEVFREIDCLECGNCCRSLGPRIKDVDIQRLSKYLKIKPSKFAEDYLRVDEDKDFVFKTMPCPFLGADNYCSVYSQRPVACREYPHTDRKRFYQVLDLTLKNSVTCPAVLEVLRRMRMPA